MSSFHSLDHADVRAAIHVPGLVLLDFWQASCAPCRALEPRLEQIARRRSGEFRGYRIEVDASPDAAGELDVQSIPTVAMPGSSHPEWSSARAGAARTTRSSGRHRSVTGVWRAQVRAPEPPEDRDRSSRSG